MFLMIASLANATYYLCKVTTSVNLRVGPGTNEEKICTIPAGSYVVVDDNYHYDNGFIYTHYVDEDIDGYISSKYLEVIEEVKVDSRGVFTKTGTSAGYDPQIEITNATSRNITIKINDKAYLFDPHEKRTLTCEPGSVEVMASSPGVIPYIGVDVVSENCLYSWEFYIRTTRR